MGQCSCQLESREDKTYYFKIQIYAFNYCKLQYIGESMQE